MKITSLETIRTEEFPNLLWVRIHTDDGLYGLGETYFGVAAVEAHLHEFVQQKLLGRNPLEIEAIWADLNHFYLGFRSSGVEGRAHSAVDIALWDLYGKVVNQPIYQLLGGRVRERIRTYNTCAGSTYVRSNLAQSTSNWGLDQDRNKAMGFDDLNLFLHHADELAQSLLESGITAMKIWPFDQYAEASNGLYISAKELDNALEPFRKIRSAVGNTMDIMVEFHSLWNLPMAIHIAEALEEFNTFWHEDPIRMASLSNLKRYAQRSKAPLCASETLSSRWAFKDLLEAEAAGIVMLDLSWCGGLSEARKIAAMAEAYQLPIAPHDCTGPVVLAASTHLSLHAPNALVQESVRAFYNGWYQDLVTVVPPVSHGFITVPDHPGLGLDLLPDVFKRKDAILRRTTL
jgi:L-alanine-DL-glutamate epimerase-like enolase superfamily enzyme